MIETDFFPIFFFVAGFAFRTKVALMFVFAQMAAHTDGCYLFL